MPELQFHRRSLYILVALLVVVALGVAAVKIHFFGFSLSSRAEFFYQVDCAVSFEPDPEEPVRISIALPEPADGWAFALDPDSEFRIEESDGRRRMERILTAPVQRNQVSCRFRLVPAPARRSPLPPPPPPSESGSSKLVSDASRAAAEAILNRVDAEKKMSPSELVPALLQELGSMSRGEKRALVPNTGGDETVEAAIMLLEMRGIPARMMRGILLDQKRYLQQPDHYLDVWYGDAWHIFRPNTGTEELPQEFLILQRNDRSLYEVSGVKRSSIGYSVTKIPAGAERLNQIRAQIIDERDLSDFSLFSLPASEQNAFKRLALLPLAILLIVLIRNIVGIPTMGTFMPVLIAMAFLEMRLLPGLVNFVLILAVGLMIRAWLSKLNLLMVPRISAVVVVVILLMQFISVAANLLQLPEFVDATFFPIIIIAWTIERASTTWEEDGATNTIKQLAASTCAAAICYFILSSAYLQYVLYTFAELNLIILGVILLLGTYTGYRFTELMRFQPLVKK